MTQAGMLRRRFALAALAAPAVAALPPRARAQALPDRPLRLLVGFSAGSPSDLLARALADRLTQSLRQSVVVDNKPGAGGLLAVRALLQAPADGSSLLVVSAAYAATPAIYRDPGFDTRDLAGITRLANVPSILIVHPKLAVRTVGELLAKMRQAPGALNFSTPGKGSANHFGTEYFLAQAKVKALHVPYRGVPEAVSAVLAGECQFSLVPAPNMLELARAGQVLALAACTGIRARVLPQVPTLAEAGVTGYRFDPWFGALTQNAAPAAARAALVAACTTALAAPEMRARFAGMGAEISALPGTQFDAYLQEEIAKFRYIAAAAGIEAG